MFLGERRELVERLDPRDRRGRAGRPRWTALLPLQREDFTGIFRAMDGLPVTIRLIDPPLHEFLPSLEELAVQRGRGRGERGEDPGHDA